MRAVSRFPVLALAALVCVGTPQAVRAQQNAASHSDDYFNFIELNGYVGWRDFEEIEHGLGTKLDEGAVLGVRMTENFWEHVAIEESYNAYSWHFLRFLSPTPGGVVLPQFPIRVFVPSVNVVYHFTPRTSRLRPFITAGAGDADYNLHRNARNAALLLPASAGFANFASGCGFLANYGAGLKYQAAPRFGLRFDVRGYSGQQPRFSLPTTSTGGSAYIPTGYPLNGIEITGGITFYLGRRGEKPAPPPPAPAPTPAPPPRTPGSLNPGTISASATSVCPGDAVRLSSNASDPEGHQMSYRWSVNGANQGGNSAQYTFTPSTSGDYRIGLHVADATDAARSADANPISIHTGVYTQPQATGATANPAELQRGQTAMLHVTGTGSECGGQLNYRWSATEGTITGNGPDAQFDSNSVSFNEGDRSRPQSKQVTATGTVTDSKGGSASASTTLTVNYPAAVRHFGDVLFPKDSARVNNCGKRVLIEQLYPLLTANTNYDVVLVGHIDSSEAPSGKVRRGRNLDRDRVLQTAAVLSGGTGTCSALDRSRIKGSWVGATQETESVPTSCAISTTAPKERKGAAIDDTNEAKNRRVEIWLVPKGMSLPAAARDAKDLPDADLRRIGCPK